jgi:hypothetical protein
MKALHDDAKPGWWNRFQQVMAALVILSGEAAQMADALRRLFG